jgi:hypothetical protein
VSGMRMLKPGLARVMLMLAGAVFLAAGLAVSSPVPGGRSDRGTFVLKLAGHEYGSEKFSIESTADKVTAQSESQLREDPSSQPIRTFSRLVLNPALEPQSYSWSDKGPEKFNLSVDFTAQPAKSVLHRPNGKDDIREFQLPKNVLILDNNVILHYQILIDRFAAAGGGKQTFQAFIPQSATPGALSVQDIGMETIPLGGSPRALHHLVVLSDNAQIDLWVDESNHLQRLYWSAPQIEALRQP